MKAYIFDDNTQGKEFNIGEIQMFKNQDVDLEILRNNEPNQG